jgi:predicted phosphodiesterase
VRLHVLSDLHLERQAFPAPEADADAVILAGDIATGTGGVDWARTWAEGRPVVYVAGNHEFYGHSTPGLLDQLRGAADGSQVAVLENEELIVGEVRFLGCTLWTDFDFDGPEHRVQSMAICQRLVNDYGQIEYGPAGRALAAQDTLTIHESSRRWLEQRLAIGHDGPTVVVTHHAPLIRFKPSNPLLRSLGGAFASDLTELMGDDRVDLWIFGHTHRSVDLERGGTRVLSNPRGYPHQPVDGFDPALVVELNGHRG